MVYRSVRWFLAECYGNRNVPYVTNVPASFNCVTEGLCVGKVKCIMLRCMVIVCNFQYYELLAVCCECRAGIACGSSCPVKH